MQTGCFVQAEAQKSPVFWQVRLFSLSGPLNRLNAKLSLLQRSCDRECDWEALSLAPYLASTHSCGSSQPPLFKPLRGLNRDSGAIVFKTRVKQARNKDAIEAAILNRILDRD